MAAEARLEFRLYKKGKGDAIYNIEKFSRKGAKTQKKTQSKTKNDSQTLLLCAFAGNFAQIHAASVQ